MNAFFSYAIHLSAKHRETPCLQGKLQCSENCECYNLGQNEKKKYSPRPTSRINASVSEL